MLHLSEYPAWLNPPIILGTLVKYLVPVAVCIALIVMGNLAGRLIGVVFLGIWLLYGLRLYRSRFAN